MKIHDISIPVSASLVSWPGEPSAEITYLHHLADGDSATVSQIHMGSHTGTHIDAPAHFISNGKTLQDIKLEYFVGKTVVVEELSAKVLDKEVIESLEIPDGTERLLFRTSNSEQRLLEKKDFFKEFVGINESGALWLTDRNIRLVGVDYLSVAPYGESVATHRILLGHDIAVVEGLNLVDVEPGEYQLVCLPLKINDIEAAPARAILIEM